MSRHRSATTMVCITLGEFIAESPKSNLYMIGDTGLAEWLPHTFTRYQSQNCALVPEWLYDKFMERAREKKLRRAKSNQ